MDRNPGAKSAPAHRPAVRRRRRRSPYTAEEDARIVALKSDGATYPEISALIGRPICSVKARVLRIDPESRERAYPRKAEASTERKLRPCIKCRRLFMSNGPGHRYCYSCRKLIDSWTASFLDETYGFGTF